MAVVWFFFFRREKECEGMSCGRLISTNSHSNRNHLFTKDNEIHQVVGKRKE